MGDLVDLPADLAISASTFESIWSSTLLRGQRAVEGDIPDEGACSAAGLGLGVKLGGFLRREAGRAQLQKWQEMFAVAGNTELLLARVDGTAAGFISYGPSRDEHRVMDGEIYAIYLLGEHWGTGVGYRLYKAAASNLHKKGFRKAHLWVLTSNHKAIAAYQKWGGVVECGRLKDNIIGGKPVKEASVLFNLK